MTGFLLDTNVPSELTRSRSDPNVEAWLNGADDDQLFLSVVSLGEMLRGVTILPASRRRQELQQWIDGTLRPWFDGRVLPVDERVAEPLLGLSPSSSDGGLVEALGTSIAGSTSRSSPSSSDGGLVEVRSLRSDGARGSRPLRRLRTAASLKFDLYDRMGRGEVVLSVVFGRRPR